VVVGADRIARNGDTANKVGTYPLALAAHAAGVPFFVAAPVSTIDARARTGSDIPIEERSSAEVTHLGGQRVAAEGVAVFNPAFDVTPARYIAAIVTERGVAKPPYDRSLSALLEASAAGVPFP
jgi:methylthioribose-1-phosphate isomerase